MLNHSYAVLLAFVAVIRLVLALLLIIQSIRLLRTLHRRQLAPIPSTPSDRYYFLALSASLLLTLNLTSWPLFYALLQRFVSEAPGIMCIYGVTRIGEGSLGPTRHLPLLIAILQLSKPLLVFIGGSWGHLHILNVRSATEPLLKKLVYIAVLFATAAVLDATVELIYLSIPKVGESMSSGCCTVDRGDQFLPSGFLEGGHEPMLYAFFFGGIAALIAAIWIVTRNTRSVPSTLAASAVFLGALAVTAIGVVFLVDVAAPRLLRLPFHHCPYDLPMRVPESLVTIAIFIAGNMCIGWLWTTRAFGTHSDTMPQMPAYLGSLARIAIWCYGVSTLMLAVEMALA